MWILGAAVSVFVGAAVGSASINAPNHHHRHFAVLVAGSSGYYNYRHQADICHAHTVLKQHGIPEQNIVLFSMDDVANSPENPIPGTLFNHPDSNGKGHNVYQDCLVDYRGEHVTVDNFEAVLTGNASAVPKGLPVLDSTEEDFVFINFVDHGEIGAVSFPNENLKRERFHHILKRMKELKMFKSMVIYIEACESGSMFDGDDGIPEGIFIVTAANATESSWGTYCPSMADPDADMVDGRHIGTCLGDLFSVNWMEDSELPQVEGETIGDQVDKITELTTRSHVQKYGDKSVANRRVTDFQGMTDDEGWVEFPAKARPPLVLVNHANEESLATASGLLTEFLGHPVGVSSTAQSTGGEDLLARRERLARHKATSSIPANIIEINNAFVKVYRESQHAGEYEEELRAVNELIQAAQARAEILRKRVVESAAVSSGVQEEAFLIESSFPPIIRSDIAFDNLLIPQDHPSRSRSDTFYISGKKAAPDRLLDGCQDTDTDWLLRPQATAHQPEMLKRVASAQSPIVGALWAADVYRKDEIDRYHYPVFHQVDGVRLFQATEVPQSVVVDDLKGTLEGLMRSLFGHSVAMRWDHSVTFPFTDPSFEMEVYYNGKWVEVLGCGVIKKEIVDHSVGPHSDLHGWAFGMGLERLAMHLFGIDDIRLFWSLDKRFLSQFSDGQLKKFEPFSNYPPVFKDVSFWIEDEVSFDLNRFYEICRETSSDCLESIEAKDEFVHPSSGKRSLCFRLVYRSFDRTLTHDLVNTMHNTVVDSMSKNLPIAVR
ncbi:hypothetical protein FOL47_004439 [Perkinsus chesapeaki]|uniref:Phenylalanyl-tRNA synthetase n=1 Tax=Perkinsus chesapeaki TaxID=330153 RepID=A0A7J6M2H9_PERCH|nr:hypothetical protein FOL47_004439 [Perkinsus chesapeaki]